MVAAEEQEASRRAAEHVEAEQAKAAEVAKAAEDAAIAEAAVAAAVARTSETPSPPPLLQLPASEQQTRPRKARSTKTLSQSISVAVSTGTVDPADPDLTGSFKGTRWLPVRCGERFIVLEPAESSSGRSRVVSFDEPDCEGFVPMKFLQYAPADGRMVEAFRGETPGEVESAAAGEPVWKLDVGAAAVNGWVDVFMASGRRGNVPAMFVEWSAGGAHQD